MPNLSGEQGFRGQDPSPSVCVLQFSQLIHNLAFRYSWSGLSCSSTEGVRTVEEERERIRLPHGLRIESHEDVPFLLVPNRCQARGVLILLDNSSESIQSRVARVDVLPEPKTCRCVFVSVVDDGLVRKGAEVAESCVHLFTGSFKESAATSDEECVASEHASCVVLVDFVGDVVAYGILCVARGSKAPENILVQRLGYGGSVVQLT